MQNINQQDVDITQGFDFQSFQIGDFTLIPNNVIVINSQKTDDGEIVNSQTTATDDCHIVNSQTAATDDSQIASVVYHVIPQSQECSSSIVGDEIFENFPNINLPEQIFASHPIFSSEKSFTSDFNKDDAVVISKDEFIQNENKQPKKRAVFHNQTEKIRRNAIKEKINILGRLLPNCNKTNQASILSDVVEYVKCLQCQHQMLSMAYMPYLPMGMGMGMGMGMVNMCGHLRGACLPFQPVASTPTPNLPIFTESNIVSYSQFRAPSAPLSPVTFNSAQVLPTANSTFDTSTVVQPQLIPYAINHTQQAESSTSQYNTNKMMDYNQNVRTPREDYKLTASCTIPPHSGSYDPFNAEFLVQPSLASSI